MVLAEPAKSMLLMEAFLHRGEIRPATVRPHRIQLQARE